MNRFVSRPATSAPSLETGGDLSQLSPTHLYQLALTELMTICARKINGHPLSVSTLFLTLSEELALRCRTRSPGYHLFLKLIAFQSQEPAMYTNPLNTTLLSLLMADWLDFSMVTRRNLALASLVHEVSMSSYWTLEWLNRPLTSPERSAIEQHVKDSSTLIHTLCERHPDMAELTVVVSQEHERIDGSGYPNQMEKREIFESAKILGLADTFEAVTHRRGHRPGSSLAEGLQIIQQHDQQFEYEHLRALKKILAPFRDQSSGLSIS